MRRNEKKVEILLIAGIALIAMFVLWTILIQCIDVKPKRNSAF